ncbi:protein rep [Magnetococcales bacterium HHB-1]
MIQPDAGFLPAQSTFFQDQNSDVCDCHPHVEDGADFTSWDPLSTPQALREHIEELRLTVDEQALDMASAGIDPDNPDPLDDSAVDQADHWHALRDELKSAESEYENVVQSVLPFGGGAADGAPLGKDVNTRTPPEGYKDAVKARFKLQETVKEILPNHSIGHCFRSRRGVENVKVVFSKAHKKTHFGGLQTCGSVWVCPVCAGHIAARRKEELEKAIESHLKDGGGIYLITYTVPHHREDDLGDMVKRFSDAQQRLKRGAPWKRIKDRFGWIGSVRALEVTHGQNGWHPHVHEVVFLSRPWNKQERPLGGVFDSEDAFLSEFKEKVFSRWSRFAVKCGFEAPSSRHGVDIQNAEFAGSYAAKWGLQDEVTKAHIKRGNGHGRSPFDLIRSYQEGDKRAGMLFMEFAGVFKGKRQLVWSKGLKARFQIQEFTDEQLAELKEDEGIVVGVFSSDDWRIVCRHNLRAEVLLAALSGWANVLSLIRVYRDPGGSASNSEDYGPSGYRMAS